LHVFISHCSSTICCIQKQCDGDDDLVMMTTMIQHLILFLLPLLELMVSHSLDHCPVKHVKALQVAIQNLNFHLIHVLL